MAESWTWSRSVCSLFVRKCRYRILLSALYLALPSCPLIVSCFVNFFSGKSKRKRQNFLPRLIQITFFQFLLSLSICFGRIYNLCYCFFSFFFVLTCGIHNTQETSNSILCHYFDGNHKRAGKRGM